MLVQNQLPDVVPESEPVVHDFLVSGLVAIDACHVNLLALKLGELSLALS